jgi:DUF2971 family protein
MNAVAYPLIQRILATPAPARVYHYTSPAGLIGIVTTRTLWATHIRFLNDTAELDHALTALRASIDARLNNPHFRPHFSAPELELLEAMLGVVGAGRGSLYVAALTLDCDDLSQWRAYCPPAGGYAFGIPSGHLRVIAASQGYYLAPCVYDHETQQAIINELVDQNVILYRRRTSAGDDARKVHNDIVQAFGWESTRYLAMLKHRAFKDEEEWRLVSPLVNIGDSRISYRPGRATIIPYVKCSFLAQPYTSCPPTGVDPDNQFMVIVGPTVDSSASQSAVASITLQHIGPGWCGYGPSDAPFRE